MNFNLKVNENNGAGEVVLSLTNHAERSFESYPEKWSSNIENKAQTEFKGDFETALQAVSVELEAMLSHPQILGIFSRMARLMKKEAVLSAIVEAAKNQSVAAAEVNATGLVDDKDWAAFMAVNDDVDSEIPSGLTRQQWNSLLGLGLDAEAQG